MHFIPTSLPGVYLVQSQVYQDERGFFMETYRLNVFTEAGIPYIFVQDNHSASRRGTLRGLHYQIRQPQGKLLRVVMGEIFDVVVDLRRSSPTFKKWYGVRLSAESRLQLWIPPGLAHGFYVLSDWAEVIYKATDYYAPDGERTLLWNDPAIGVEWPIAEAGGPLISKKDAMGKTFTALSEDELFD